MHGESNLEPAVLAEKMPVKSLKELLFPARGVKREHLRPTDKHTFCR
jgi:hypothetical protein